MGQPCGRRGRRHRRVIERQPRVRHGAAATPAPLIAALIRRRDLEHVTLYHLHTTGPAPFVDAEHDGRFHSISLFAGPPVRTAIAEGRPRAHRHELRDGHEARLRLRRRNTFVEFHPCDRTNDTALIRKNDQVAAINSALEVDLSGQVCADSIGFRIYSGIGGQMDFIRGSALSRGGRPIIALPSTAAAGRLSRIVPALQEGAGVVTTRGHVHWVVTEYGAVNLFGLSLRQRGEALVSLAHPDFRGELTRALAATRHFTIRRAPS